MRTYCSLVISSNTDARLASTVQEVLGLHSENVVDTHHPDVARRRAKMAQLVGMPTPTPLRYFWSLSSQNEVDGHDVATHVNWLLNQVKPGVKVKEIHEHGSSACLSCFWAGNGRGGGPVLVGQLLQTIAAHGVELEFDFYVES